MGQEATGFYRKNEIRRSRFSPIVKGGFCRKTIKAVVQLDCIEVFASKSRAFHLEIFSLDKKDPASACNGIRMCRYESHRS